jgi:N-terminal acetyltransferase B complex non-catalytic subunit
VKTQSSERLVETLHLLNYLLKNSPSNFHAKLLCLQIYHILGCTLGAHKVYEALDIKHIQLDSMGYLHCAQLPSGGIATLAKPLYDQTLKFFTQSYKDSLEYLAMSYKFGSFSKLQEFMDFREKLSNSLQYSLISMEAMIQEICHYNGSPQQNFLQFSNMKIEPNEDRIKYDELTDNRDLEVIVRWDPTYQYISSEDGAAIDPIPIHQKIKEMEKESFVQDIELVQMRSALLRLVAASVELPATPYSSAKDDVSNGESDTKDSAAKKQEIYTILLDSWNELYLRIRKLKYQPTSEQFLVNLLPSRLHQMIELPYEEIFSCLGKFLKNLWMGSAKAKPCMENLLKSFDSIKKLLKCLEAQEKRISFYKNCRNSVVGCVEILSLCSFVLSNCYDKYNQLGNQSQGRKKKQQNIKESSVLSDKEKAGMVAEVLKYLKTYILDVEGMIGECLKLCLF